MELELRIIKASYHRNGVGGMGFYAILFNDKEHGDMIASLFDEPGYCAVYMLQGLAAHNIEFANGNSWRGDRYEDALRPLLDIYLQAEGTNRFGPFAMPG